MRSHSFSLLRKIYYLKSVRVSDLFSENISFAEYVMLQLVAEISEETVDTNVWVSDIVKRVEVTPQAVSKFIRLIARKGYIKRFEKANDRRSMGIRLTERGKAVLAETEEELGLFCESVAGEFSEEELITMHRLMEKLQKAVQINCVKYKKK